MPRYSLQIWLFILAGALVLLMPAIANGFPFVFEDSIEYVIFTPRLYRSPFYQLFIFFFHLNTFIWLPVVAQSIIFSHLIYTIVSLSLRQHQLPIFAVIIFALTIGSSLPFAAGIIMPDAFTSIVILSIGLLAFYYSQLSFWERLYFFLLACVSISVHLSHLSIAAALLGVVVVVYVLQRRPLKDARAPLALIASSILLTAAALGLNNIVVHGIGALSPAGPTFFLGNLVEHGPARRYLEEACPHAGYKICEKLDELPKTSFDMIWNTDFYEKLGGFQGMRDEASQIVAATILSRPADVLNMARDLITQAVFTRGPAGDLRPIAREVWWEAAIQKFGPATTAAYHQSIQANDLLPRDLLRAIDAMVFPLSIALVITAGAWAARSRWNDLAALTLLIVSGIAVNTVVCAVLSGVYGRYQYRVTWLLPFIAMVLIFRILESRSEEKEAKQLQPSS